MKKLSMFSMLWVLICIMAINTAYSQQITQTKARKIISNFLILKNRSDYNIKDISPYKRTDDPFIYIARMEPSGFVILSNDQRSYPVFAYSFSSDFQFGDIPVAVENKLKQYEFIVSYYRNNNLDAGDRAGSAWRILESMDHYSYNREYVDPLLSTTWNQNRYYNDLCPQDSGVYPNMNYHTPAGCVSIAMAQVLKFHSHPARGIGEHCYNSPDYGEQCAYFDQQDYLYDLMPDELSDYNNEVARLIYHCGVSVEMTYGTYSSVAFMPDVEYALVDHFRYKDEIDRLFKSNYTLDEWANKLKSELHNGLPVIMCGSGVNGTHAFVCDGFDEDGLFHFNWGWGGSFDGYFEIGDLNPGPYHFDDNQEGFFNVIPAPVGVDEGAEISGLNIFPNPVKEFIHITGLEGASVDKLEIYNINGTMIKNMEMPGSDISVGSIKPGFYVVRILSGNKTGQARMIKM